MKLFFTALAKGTETAPNCPFLRLLKTPDALKTYDTMIVNRFNRFDGIVSGIKSCRAEIRCQVLDALSMNRINLASLTKQTLYNAVFLRANGVRSTKMASPASDFRYVD